MFIAEVAETSSQRSIALTVSYALTLNQTAIIAGPVIFGFLVDWHNSYVLPWIILANLLSVSGVWLWWSEHISTPNKGRTLRKHF